MHLYLHHNSSVRQSLLFSVSMLLLAVPGHMFIDDLHIEMTELKEWLQGTHLIAGLDISGYHVTMAIVVYRFFLFGLDKCKKFHSSLPKVKVQFVLGRLKLDRILMGHSIMV